MVKASKKQGSKASKATEQRQASMHILYLETAEDQRRPGCKERSQGVHLGVQGLGPVLCDACGGVADVWRGRLDNVQTSLRMCCSEGLLFRPFVSQLAFVSPRAALRYDIRLLGKWMVGQGTKRPTESVVIGSALRVVVGSLLPEECGIKHDAFEPSDSDQDNGMWIWLRKWVAAVRSHGHAVVVTLDKSSPVLVSSAASGAIASHMGRASDITDVIVVVGGPAGIPASWQRRLDTMLGEPLLKVALLGGLQHSYAALLELLLLHERGQLMPALLDRLVMTPEQATQWAEAQIEFARVWLGCMGCVRRRPTRSTHLGSPAISPQVPNFASGQMRSSPAAPPNFDALLKRHQSLITHMAEIQHSPGGLAGSGLSLHAVDSERLPRSSEANRVRPSQPASLETTEVATDAVAPRTHFKKRKRKRKHELGGGNTSDTAANADTTYTNSKQRRKRKRAIGKIVTVSNRGD